MKQIREQFLYQAVKILTMQILVGANQYEHLAKSATLDNIMVHFKTKHETAYNCDVLSCTLAQVVQTKVINLEFLFTSTIHDAKIVVTM